MKIRENRFKLKNILIFIFLLFFLISSANALESPLKFDFSKTSDYIKLNYTNVLPILYNSTSGYGWNITVSSYQGYIPMPHLNGMRDFHYSSNDASFLVDLPNGKYSIELTFFRRGVDSYDNIQVFSEGNMVFSDIDVYQDTFIEKEFDVEVLDGQLDISFSDNGGVGTSWLICEMLIEEQKLRPKINSINDKVKHNESFIITGVNFGLKATSEPIKFETFEGFGEGDNLRDNSTWWNTRENLAQVDISSKKSRSVNSLLSGEAYVSNNGAPEFWKKEVGFSDTRKAYVNFWFNPARVQGWNANENGSQFKTFKLLGNVSDSGIGSYPGYEFFVWEYDDPQVIQYTVHNGVISPTYTDYFEQNCVEFGDVWYNYALQMDFGDIGEVNGDIKLWLSRNGMSYNTVKNENPRLQDVGEPIMDYVYFHNYLDVNSDSDGIFNTTWYYDDIYIDNSWARVEIGDNPIYEDCTHREIQYINSWSNESINVIFNQGSFNDSEDMYLFIVNEEGIVNYEGYKIVENNQSLFPIRLDFDDTDYLTHPDYIQVKPELFNLTLGYGWNESVSSGSFWVGKIYDYHLSDRHYSADPATFIINISNGNYTVEMLFYNRLNTLDNIVIKAEDNIIYDDLDIIPNYYTTKSFNVEVVDNSLEIDFLDNDVSESYWFINAITIYNKSISKPLITGTIKGTVEHGEQIVILGNNFGQKEVASPLKWETFENANVGDDLNDTGYFEKRKSDTNATIIDDMGRHSYGAKHLRHTTSTELESEFDWLIRKNIGFADKNGTVYVNFWTKMNLSFGDESWQYKIFRITNDEYSENPGLRSFMWTTGGESASQYYYTIDPSSVRMDPPTTHRPLENEWFNVQIMYKDSTLDNMDGIVNIFTSLTPNKVGPYHKIHTQHGSRVTGLTEGFVSSFLLGSGIASGAGGEIAVGYWDDIYIDNSWARVEIGDKSKYEECTVREIQYPNSWSNNSINITINKGVFNDSDDMYLFVVDETGVVNDVGYKIVKDTALNYNLEIVDNGPVFENESIFIYADYYDSLNSSNKIFNANCTLFIDGTEYSMSNFSSFYYYNLTLSSSDIYNYNVSCNLGMSPIKSKLGNLTVKKIIHPTITNVIRNESNNTIHISGFNFKSKPNVILFDDFEQNVMYEDVSLTGLKEGNWSIYQTYHGTTANTSHSGYKSMEIYRYNYSDAGDRLSKGVQKIFDEPISEIYLSYWVRIPNGTNFPGLESEGLVPGELASTSSWKFMWLMDQNRGDFGNDDYCLPTYIGNTFEIAGNHGYVSDAFPYSSNRLGIPQNWWSFDNWMRVSLWMRGNPKFLNMAEEDPRAWHDDVRFEFLTEDVNSSIVANNRVRVFDGHEDSGGDWDNSISQWTHLKIPGWIRGGAVNTRPVYDDIYIATGESSQARVEICDNALWEDCLNKAHQIPVSWNDSEIVVSYNEGSFSDNQDMYLYVIDEDGVVNEGGYKIVGSIPEQNFRLPLKIDFNENNVNTFRNFTGFEVSLYNASVGYGWNRTVNAFEDYIGTDVYLKGIRDIHYSSEPASFLIDLEDGNYTVELIFFTRLNNIYDDIQIHSEGNLIFNDIDVVNGAPLFKKFDIEVLDGQLDISFEDMGGLENNWAISELIISKSLNRPQINSIEGTLINGNNISISGINFNEHQDNGDDGYSYLNSRFDDFESGFVDSWWNDGNGVLNSSGYQRGNSNYSILHSSLNHKIEKRYTENHTKMYLSAWFYFPLEWGEQNFSNAQSKLIGPTTPAKPNILFNC